MARIAEVRHQSSEFGVAAAAFLLAFQEPFFDLIDLVLTDGGNT